MERGRGRRHEGTKWFLRGFLIRALLCPQTESGKWEHKCRQKQYRPAHKTLQYGTCSSESQPFRQITSVKSPFRQVSAETSAARRLGCCEFTGLVRTILEPVCAFSGRVGECCVGMTVVTAMTVITGIPRFDRSEEGRTKCSSCPKKPTPKRSHSGEGKSQRAKGFGMNRNETASWKVCKLLKTCWPGTESNRRRQPFQGCYLR